MWCAREGDVEDFNTHDGMCPDPFLREAIKRLAEAERKVKMVDQIAAERNKLRRKLRRLNRMRK
jgi:hypothetical protein